MAQTNKDKTKQSETLKKVFRYLGKYRIYLLFTILLAASDRGTDSVCTEADRSGSG